MIFNPVLRVRPISSTPVRFASQPAEPPEPDDSGGMDLREYEALRMMQSRFYFLGELLRPSQTVELVNFHGEPLDSGKPVELKLRDGKKYTFQVFRDSDTNGASQEMYRLVRNPVFPTWFKWLPKLIRQPIEACNRDEWFMRDVAGQPNNAVELSVKHGFHDARLWSDSGDSKFPAPGFLDKAQSAFYRLEVLVEKAIAARSKPESD